MDSHVTANLQIPSLANPVLVPEPSTPNFTRLWQILTPIVKLLRLMDGNKPAMGKIYDRMFMIGEKINDSTVSWKQKALEGVKAAAAGKPTTEGFNARWEYLHSPFHAAGMALDPEFMARASDFDDATQEGVMLIIERLSLKDVIFESANPATAMLTLTTESPKVAERIAATMVELSQYQASEGIFTKAHVQLAAKTMAPAAWWATFGKAMPLLSAVARQVQVLAQPVRVVGRAQLVRLRQDQDG